MASGQEIRLVGADTDTEDLLRHLIKERFPGQTVVTASLRASSIIILKMVADIDPETPVIFCRRPPVFAESTEYRAKITQSLGLRNTSVSDGHETEVRPQDLDHCEHMWIQHEIPGRSFQILHLNDCLAPFSCWISAVYHEAPATSGRSRIAVEGKLTRVDPLYHWSEEEIRSYMKAHGLPYHQMAKRGYRHRKVTEKTSPTYHY